jgi:hypothetical protein
MSRPEIEPNRRRSQRGLALAAATALSAVALLAGCSDLYYDRRDTIALSAGDAIAANAAEQTVDPWPPNSGNRNIPVDGQRMVTAVERYRLNKTVQPVDAMTLEGVNQQQAAQPAQTASSGNGTGNGSSSGSGTTAQASGQ